MLSASDMSYGGGYGGDQVSRPPPVGLAPVSNIQPDQYGVSY